MFKGIRDYKIDAYGTTNMLHFSIPFISIFILYGFIRAPFLAPRLLF